MTQHQNRYLLWDGSMRVELNAEPHRRVISFPWNTGSPIDAMPDITAVVSTKDLPDRMVVGSINYVSDRLKRLLEDSQISAQFFPVIELRTRRGKLIETPRFYAMNLLARIACFDFENSDFSMGLDALGGFKEIRRLCILEDQLCNAPVAVMRERPYVLIRRDLMEKLREHRIRGCRWREIEDVRFPQTDWPAES